MRRSAVLASRSNALSKANALADIEGNACGRKDEEMMASSTTSLLMPLKRKFCPPRSKLDIPASQTLSVGKSVPSSNCTPISASDEETLVYRVFFCKRSNKKHKSYADGIMLRKKGKFTLFDEAGKQLCCKSQSGICERLGQGSEIECGTYDVEVDKPVELAQFESGTIFLGGMSVPAPSSSVLNPSKPSVRIAFKVSRNIFQQTENDDDESVVQTDQGESTGLSQKIPARSSVPVAGFRQMKDISASLSRNNPFAANALILHKPLSINGDKKTDRFVVVSPFITATLRPHQREGIKFLYDCLMGNANPGHCGCILADEMGLGKTLQCIVVVYTMLKDGPIPGKEAASRALIVVPSSLVDNWANEFKKWLGSHRMATLAMQSSAKLADQKTMIHDFVHATRWPVLIISYEMCRKFKSELASAANKKFGMILICDEGHRLKNAQGNRTISALEEIGAHRRIIITGTPIQNDLEELYAMCSFVNPGQMLNLEAFRNNFIKPITKWRDSGDSCSEAETNLGAKRAATLQALTGNFILRRTSDILSKFLPPKLETVVFCRLSSLQISLYQTFLKSKHVSQMLQTCDHAAALSCITTLRKLVNDPSLVYDPNHLDQMADLPFPENYDPVSDDFTDSAKIEVVSSILDVLNQYEPPMKTVIISNFKQTLDVIERLCGAKNLLLLRLDGSTPSQLRQGLVKRFNDADGPETVFLLSSKAGGCGLNLIGASRLILFDPDWNPATDEQAMARIWRDGQKFPCVIYRLLTTGGMDEKIFQRQLAKQELALILNSKGSGKVQRLGRDELKNLFTLSNETEFCQTLSMMEKDKDVQSLWKLHREMDSVEDLALETVETMLPPGSITFVMTKTTVRQTPQPMTDLDNDEVHCLPAVDDKQDFE